MKGLRRWAWWPVWSGLILLSIAGANLLSLRWHPGATYKVDVGFWGDQELLEGFFEQEADALGATYRWTGAQSAFRVRGFASVTHPILQLGVGGLPRGAPAPRPVQLRIDGTALTLPVAAAPRRYYLSLPSGALLDGNLDVDFASDTSRVAPDQRDVGIRLDDVVLGWTGATWVLPAWPTLLTQWALVLICLGIAWRLELPGSIRLGIAALLIPLLGWMTAYDLLMAAAWEARLLAASMLLLALAWNAFGLLNHLLPGLGSRRDLRWLSAITVVAISMRLFAIFYPPFGSHDLYIHRDRLLDLQLGSIQLFDTPSEFNGSRTIVPPAFYMLASPLTLLTAKPDAAIQGLYAFLDGASALVMAILVRQLGGSVRAAAVAAILIASLPIQLTALWWGFGPQVVAQWLGLALAVFVSRPGPAPSDFWIVAGVLLGLVLLMHPGSAILAAVWLAGYVLLVWWRDRQARRQWLGWALVLVGSSLLATLLLYIDVLWLQLNGLARGVATPQRFDTVSRITLIGKGMLASLRPIGVPLSILSLSVLVRRTCGNQRRLVIAWLGSAGLFFVVDLLFGLQVRYAYFAIPLLCAGLGLLLDQLMARRRWGRVVSWGLLGFVSFAGLSLWVNGVFLGVKPTLMALLH